MTLPVQIIEENGGLKFAVLPYQSYQTLAHELANFDSFEDFFRLCPTIKGES